MLFTIFKSLFIPEIFNQILIKYYEKGYFSPFVSQMFDSLQ